MKSRNFLMDGGASPSIRDSAVISGNLEHSNASELRDLTPNTARTLDRHRHRLSTCWLGPAEFLHKEPVEVKLLEAVAQSAEI
jgi:hypothetical protein